MNKRKISLFLALCMLFSAFSTVVYADNNISSEYVYADMSGTTSDTCGDNLIWHLDDNGTLTISGTGDMYNYDSWNSDYCILAPWFSNRSSIKSVVIENGVTSIGSYAFFYCNNLETVTIPNSVTNIGGSAFLDCESLASITIPEPVTSIGGGAFNNTALYNDESNWKLGVLYIGEYLIHARADTLRASYTIKNGTKVIAGGAFSSCTNLSSITIPDSVTSIGSNAFSSCTNLDDVSIPHSVTNIGNSAFYKCSSLSSVIIPDSVTSIAIAVFEACTTLSSVTIPSSVTSIGARAFYGCTRLASVTIPESVDSIGNAVFSGCNGLSSITIANDYVMSHIDFQNLKNLESVILKNGVTSITENTFKNCTSLRTVTIPDSVTNIGNFAFYKCNNLETVTIPDSVSSIGSSAFEGCDSLTSVTIPDSVTNIGYRAFCNCTSLTSVKITDISAWCNIEFDGIYSNPLYYAKNLYLNDELIKELIIPNSVTNIGEKLFFDCDSLTSVIIPDSVVTIGKQAFDFCDNLKSITIGKGVSSIGDVAFGYDEAGAIEGFTVIGYVGSAAETYANDHDLTFVDIESIVYPTEDSKVYIDVETATMPNVVADMTSEDIISKLSTFGITATITNKDGKALKATEKVGTGCIVTDQNGNAYTVIVKGDVDGSGEIDSTDYLKIKSYFLSMSQLEDGYYSAADVEKNSEIDATDYLKLKSHFLGLNNIYA